jgi:hypothetical protein
MEKTPFAEEFLNNFSFRAGEHIGNKDFETMEEYARQFAKLHCEAQLKAILENAEIKIKDNYSESYSLVKSETVNYNSKGVYGVYPEECTKHTIEINKDSIINAYDLNNIK